MPLVIPALRLLAIVGTLALLSPPALGAAVLLHAHAYAQGPEGEVEGPYAEYAGETSARQTARSTAENGPNYASATAGGGRGIADAYAKADSRQNAADAYALAWSTSQVTLDVAPSYAGSGQAVITAQIEMDGYVEGARDDSRNSYIAHAEGAFSVNGNDEIVKGQDVNDGVFIGDAGGTFIVFYVVSIGVATEYTLYASASATAFTVEGQSEATADWSHTVRWMGVTSVTQMDGTPITDFTLTDEDGHDWIAPAPEPTAAALLLLPLLGRRHRATSIRA